MNNNPYMNQNMSANMRNMNMRGNYGYPNPGQGARPMANDCGCGVSPAAQRSASNDCGCGNGTAYQRTAEMPTGDRKSLLAYIDQVSFGAYEAVLYLDTHSDCQEGMQYFRDLNEKRNSALKEYAKLYGPLNLMQAGESCEAYWQWVNQPWPWEGGNC